LHALGCAHRETPDRDKTHRHDLDRVRGIGIGKALAMLRMKGRDQLREPRRRRAGVVPRYRQFESLATIAEVGRKAAFGITGGNAIRRQEGRAALPKITGDGRELWQMRGIGRHHAALREIVLDIGMQNAESGKSAGVGGKDHFADAEFLGYLDRVQAAGAASTESARGSAIRAAIAARAASRSSGMAPPRKKSASSRPSTRLASVTVGAVPPRR